MSGNPHHARHQRGEKLARELEQFVLRETPDRDEAAEVLRGAYEYLDRRTRLIRGGSPWPAEPRSARPDGGESD